MQGSATLGTIALGAGLLFAVLGGPSAATDDGGWAVVRLVIGLSLSVIGLGLLLCSLVLAGIGWYIRNGRPD